MSRAWIVAPAALLACVASLAFSPTTATATGRLALTSATAGGTMIEPNGDETPWLRHPRNFGWSARSAAGTAHDVSWRRWAARRAVGRGWTRFCLPNGACGRTHVVFVASKKRGGPREGDFFYYYCSLTARGRFDPGSERSVTIRLPPPEPCKR